MEKARMSDPRVRANLQFRPSQIADLLRWLTDAPFHGEIIRCWQVRHQVRCQEWADFEIHRTVLVDLEHWPRGRTYKLPPRALNLINGKRA